MRYPLLGLTIAVTAVLAAWGLDAARPDALDAVRVGFALAALFCWLPLLLATFYAFRCHELERRAGDAYRHAARRARS